MIRIFKTNSRIKWSAYQNPDGSKGGMIADTAVIDEGVFIPVSAIVMPAVHVTHQTEIRNGDLVTGEGPIRFTP